MGSRSLPQPDERHTAEGIELRTNEIPAIEREYRIELLRKAIHLVSIVIPIVYFYTPRSFALSILIPLTVAFLVVDVARYYNRSVEGWFYRWFGWLLRQHEKDTASKRLNGATNVLIAAFLTVAIFPKVIAVTAFAILIISDSMSALVGRRFGKHRFFGKSLEGSTAFFVFGALVVLVSPKISGSLTEYLIGFVGCAVGAVVEALPIKLDDNLTIPLGVGTTMWLLYQWFLPSLNLSLLQ